MTTDAIASAPDRNWLGHPKGLTILFGTEMWERFSYYGMRALLVLYLTKYLLLPGHVEHVVWYPQIKSFFEYFSGPLDIQPLSSLIYGTYTGLVYATPLIGGYLADRFFGQRGIVIVGILLMALGHFMMAFEQLLFPALFLLIVGVGVFKTNTTSQVGMLYAPGDHRRDRAYSIFYVGINIGAFLSPLVCGSLGEGWGWHYGFGAAGVGMLIALAIYIAGWRNLPPDRLAEAKAHRQDKRPLTRDEWRSVAALILTCLPLTFFWACYEQQGNTIALWADANTDRNIDLLFWRGEIPTTWFQSFNPFMIFAFTPFVVALWSRQTKRGTEPNSIVKMAYGCFLMAAANLLMFAAAWHVGEAGRASWLWLALYFVLLTTGELYLSPISLSLFSKVAPVQIASTMMAVNFIPNFVGGGFLAGYLGSFWSTMDKATFFLTIAAISAAAGVVIWLFDRPLKPFLKE